MVTTREDVEFESGAIFVIQDGVQDDRQLIVIFKK